MFFLMLSSQHWLAKLGGSAYELITRFGGPGILILAIADSSFLSFPEGNDLLIVVLSAGGSWGNMAYYVAMTITGSLIGCMLLYYVGRKGGNPLLKRRFSEKSIHRAESLFERFGVLTVVIPSILPPPMPFKIFVLSAGVFQLPAVRFIAAVALGRTIRYSMWGILAVIYGNAVKNYMQENLQVVGAVLLAGFALILAGSIGYYAYRYRVNRTRESV